MNDQQKLIVEENPGIHIFPLGIDEDPLPEGYKYLIVKRLCSEKDYYVKDVNDVKMFFLMKNILFNMSSDAGIVFDNESLKCEYLDDKKMSCRVSATAFIRKPESDEVKSFATSCTEDIEVKVEQYRDNLELLIEYGLPEGEAYKNMIARYKGTWVTVGEEKRYHLNTEDKEKCLEKETRKYLLNRRANAPQSVETQVKKKLIKELANIESAYPMSRCKEPFVIIRPVKETSKMDVSDDQRKRNEAKKNEMF